MLQSLASADSLPILPHTIHADLGGKMARGGSTVRSRRTPIRSRVRWDHRSSSIKPGGVGELQRYRVKRSSALTSPSSRLTEFTAAKGTSWPSPNVTERLNFQRHAGGNFDQVGQHLDQVLKG